MEREEQIKQAAIERGCIKNTAEYFGFIQGARYADQNPTSPWISVKKRLPKENETVLLWLGGCYKAALLRDCRWWECTGFKIGGGWSALDALSIREIEHITHWMPISPELNND